MGLEGLRERLYAHVRAHPGAHVLELADALGLSHPTVLYHLRILEDEGYVQTDATGRRRCAFDTQAHFNGWERAVVMTLQSEAGRVLEYVAENPGTYQRELARELGVSATTVKRAVPDLTELDLVEEEPGFRRRLHLAPAFLDRAQGLLEKLPTGELRVRVEAILAREDARQAEVAAEEEASLRFEAQNRLLRG